MINVTMEVSINYVLSPLCLYLLQLQQYFSQFIVLYKNTKTPMGKSQQRAEFSGLWQSSWSANSNYLHFWLSILKSVEEIHLRLYQSHKDPKFPGAWGQSLCSRQIQIVVYLTIPCKLLSANTIQYFMGFYTSQDVGPRHLL